MLFRSAALFMATATIAAGNSVEVPLAEVSANSKLGQKIMSKARRLEQNQYQNYQNGNYNQQQQQNNGEVGYWVAGYSLKFENCGTSSEYFAFEGEGGGGDRNGYMMGKQTLAHFSLCPTGSSSSAKCGSYALPLGQFLELWNQAKMDAIEYDCEQTGNMCKQYTCNGNENEDYCMYNCFVNAGLDGMCNEGNNQNNNNQNGGYEFDLERAARCDRMEGVDQDSVYYYMQENGLTNNYYGGEMGLFIGPQCSADGKSVYLDVFIDQWCSNKAPSGAFEKFSYGQSLPYTKSSGKSMIDSNSISCKEPQDQNDQNNNDRNDADQILEVCEKAYQNAAKCESSMDSSTVYYPNTYGCSLINSMKKPGKSSSRSSGHSSAAGVFVGLFAVTTVAFAGVAYYFYQKSERSNVNLSETGEGALA